MFYQAYKNLHLHKKKEKKIGIGIKSFGSYTDTQIGPWFRFLIPKPGFGRTLIETQGTL